MVNIEFQEPRSFEGNDATSKAAMFQPLPVRFTVGGADLLGYAYDETDEEEELEHARSSDFRWYPLSILHFARWGIHALRRALRDGRYVYELGRYGNSGNALLFKLDGSNMLIYSTMSDKHVSVPYIELEEAWKQFARQVREFVLLMCPALAADPGWGEWLTGSGEEGKKAEDGSLGTEANTELFPYWHNWFEEYGANFSTEQ